MTALRWEREPYGGKAEFVDVPGTGRYLVKRIAPHQRMFRAWLNGKPTSFFGETMDHVKSSVQRSVTALRLGELNKAAVSTAASPLPLAADLSESIRVLLMGGAPPWVENVERRDDSTLCVLTPGRVFEVTVR
jgi:hypothetical protein